MIGFFKHDRYDGGSRSLKRVQGGSNWQQVEHGEGCLLSHVGGSCAFCEKLKKIYCKIKMSWSLWGAVFKVQVLSLHIVGIKTHFCYLYTAKSHQHLQWRSLGSATGSTRFLITANSIKALTQHNLVKVNDSSPQKCKIWTLFEDNLLLSFSGLK